MFVCATVCPEVLPDLFKYKPDGHSTEDSKGATPLHRAAEGRQPVSIRVLLRAGAAVNALSKEGCTPLHFAARAGCAEAVRLLLEGGANVLIPNASGENAWNMVRLRVCAQRASVLFVFACVCLSVCIICVT